MKIAQVVSTFPPYHGGIGNVCYHNSLELAKLGHNITVFTVDYKKEYDNDPKEIKIIRLKPLLKYGNAGIVPQLFKELQSFDIIHLHCPFLGGAEIIWLLKKIKKRKIKLVITYQMDTVGKGILRLFFMIYNKLFTLSILKSADVIIVSSFDYLKHSLIKKSFRRNKSKFIELPNGVDVEKFSPQSVDRKFLEKFNISGNKKIILFVGGLDRAHYFKGLDYLLKAFQLINGQSENIVLVVVGGGELKNYFIKQAETLAISNKVIFAGNVNNNDLIKFYNMSDVLVLPSVDKTEAFGMVLLEAMACKKPVIASDLPGVRTLIKNGINGFLVQPKDINELSKKIKKILNDENLALEMGENGRKKTEEKYSWKKIVSKLEKIYLNVAKK